MRNKKSIYELRKKIKLLIVLISILGIILIGAVFCFYLSQFNGPLSSEINDWGNFGSYFGGLLSPVLSFLSLILLAFTIYVTTEISQQQVDAMKDESVSALLLSKKEEILESVTEIYNDFYRLVIIPFSSSTDKVLENDYPLIDVSQDFYELQTAFYRKMAHFTMLYKLYVSDKELLETLITFESYTYSILINASYSAADKKIMILLPAHPLNPNKEGIVELYSSDFLGQFYAKIWNDLAAYTPQRIEEYPDMTYFNKDKALEAIYILYKNYSLKN